jgi:endo-1,4-beta-D-glucanase Y
MRGFAVTLCLLLVACAADPPGGGGGGGDDDDGGGGDDGGGPGGGDGGPGMPSCDGTSGASQPFGAHQRGYAAGILPDHRSQADLDDAVRVAYDTWKASYLVAGCGDGRYYVATDMGESQTVSEAHGYGMIIVAYMAGHDPEAQAIFDGLYRYFRDHPSEGSPELMAWSQDAQCDNNQGAASATDGDLDIAYALLLADKQWGSGGAIDYLAEAKRVADAIVAAETSSSRRWVLLGDWPSPGSQTYNATRSSDFMPSHFASFAAATGDGAWDQLTDATFQTFAEVTAAHAPGTGLLPDFILDPGDGPYPPGGTFLEHASDGAYAYNACRVPWRVALHYLLSGDPRARDVAQKITSWLRAETGGDPGNIAAGYALSGAPLPGSGYTAMAFVAPFAVGAMVDASHQDWLNSLWDFVEGAGSGGYYNDTLRVLAMITMSGNWWAPESAPCPH